MDDGIVLHIMPVIISVSVYGLLLVTFSHFSFSHDITLMQEHQSNWISSSIYRCFSQITWCRCHSSHLFCWNIYHLNTFCDWSSCPNNKPSSKSHRYYDHLAAFIQDPGQLGLGSIFVHATEYDRKWIASCRSICLYVSSPIYSGFLFWIYMQRQLSWYIYDFLIPL